MVSAYGSFDCIFSSIKKFFRVEFIRYLFIYLFGYKLLLPDNIFPLLSS